MNYEVEFTISVDDKMNQSCKGVSSLITQLIESDNRLSISTPFVKEINDDC